MARRNSSAVASSRPGPCPVGCGATCPPPALCSTCWPLVPATLRARVWVTYHAYRELEVTEDDLRRVVRQAAAAVRRARRAAEGEGGGKGVDFNGGGPRA